MRDNTLAIDRTLQRTADEVRKLYSGSAVHGVFKPEEGINPFKSALQICLDGEWGKFVQLTLDSMNFLAAEMKKKSASAGGYVFFFPQSSDRAKISTALFKQNQEKAWYSR